MAATRIKFLTTRTCAVELLNQHGRLDTLRVSPVLSPSGNLPTTTTSAAISPNARSLFLGSYGRKLLRTRNTQSILFKEGILFGIGYEQWKDARRRSDWDGDFIEYQNYLQINVLQELLGITSIRADAIVHKYPIFHFTDAEQIKESFKYLTEMDVTVERLLKMPSLLAIDADTIKAKSNRIMKLLDITTVQTAAPFLEIQYNRLNYLSKLWKSEMKHFKDSSINRLYYLSSYLKCEPYEVTDMMRKVPHLMSMSFVSSLSQKLQLLLDAGIQPEDIVKDPYVFSQNMDAIKEQLEICKSAKTPIVIKPWMLRCPRTKIEDHVRRLDLESELLSSHGDIIGYLQQALKCDSATIHKLLTRVPALKSVSAIKLHDMIAYLHSRGFTSSDIMNNPYVLLHSQATIDERLAELNSLGYETKQLPSIICISSRRYKSFVRSLMMQEESLVVKQD